MGNFYIKTEWIQKKLDKHIEYGYDSKAELMRAALREFFNKRDKNERTRV